MSKFWSDHKFKLNVTGASGQTPINISGDNDIDVIVDSTTITPGTLTAIGTASNIANKTISLIPKNKKYATTEVKISTKDKDGKTTKTKNNTIEVMMATTPSDISIGNTTINVPSLPNKSSLISVSGFAYYDLVTTGNPYYVDLTQSKYNNLISTSDVIPTQFTVCTNFTNDIIGSSELSIPAIIVCSAGKVAENPVKKTFNITLRQTPTSIGIEKILVNDEIYLLSSLTGKPRDVIVYVNDVIKIYTKVYPDYAFDNAVDYNASSNLQEIPRLGKINDDANWAYYKVTGTGDDSVTASSHMNYLVRKTIYIKTLPKIEPKEELDISSMKFDITADKNAININNVAYITVTCYNFNFETHKDNLSIRSSNPSIVSVENEFDDVSENGCTFYATALAEGSANITLYYNPPTTSLSATVSKSVKLATITIDVFGLSFSITRKY